MHGHDQKQGIRLCFQKATAYIIASLFPPADKLYLFIQAIATSPNYSEAVQLLGYTPTAAPVYFIIAGANPGEGAVITKGRLEPEDIWTIDPNTGRWKQNLSEYDQEMPQSHIADQHTAHDIKCNKSKATSILFPIWRIAKLETTLSTARQYKDHTPHPTKNKNKNGANNNNKPTTKQPPAKVIEGG